MSCSKSRFSDAKKISHQGDMSSSITRWTNLGGVAHPLILLGILPNISLHYLRDLHILSQRFTQPGYHAEF